MRPRVGPASPLRSTRTRPPSDRAADLEQAEAGAVEVLDPVHVRRGDEPAVEVVGPGVVRALDARADLALGLLDEARAAVAAGVEEGARRRRPRRAIDEDAVAPISRIR